MSSSPIYPATNPNRPVVTQTRDNMLMEPWEGGGEDCSGRYLNFNLSDDRYELSDSGIAYCHMIPAQLPKVKPRVIDK